MLILQRKKGQTILIGDDIRITVLDNTNEQIKLAIEAPKSVPILREELLLAANANKEAASPLPDSLTHLIKSSNTNIN